jgi:hypothetical protein
MTLTSPVQSRIRCCARGGSFVTIAAVTASDEQILDLAYFLARQR